MKESKILFKKFVLPSGTLFSEILLGSRDWNALPIVHGLYKTYGFKFSPSTCRICVQSLNIRNLKTTLAPPQATQRKISLIGSIKSGQMDIKMMSTFCHNKSADHWKYIAYGGINLLKMLVLLNTLHSPKAAVPHYNLCRDLLLAPRHATRAPLSLYHPEVGLNVLLLILPVPPWLL